MTIFGVLAQFCCARDRERHLSPRLAGLILAAVLGFGTLPAPAQEVDDSPTPTDEAVAQALAAQSGRGPVTNLPLPRYVSLKGSEGNARRGPSLSHRIDWVFTHPGMPLRVTAEFGHWRRVEDRDGAGGWVHYALLSGVRTVIVEEDMTELHARADAKSAVVALAEMGAVAQLENCTPDWCEISAEEADGWVPKTAIWGVDADEIRD